MSDEKYKRQLIDIGLNIKYYRLKKGYTQEQLANLVFITKQQISRIESPNCPSATRLDTLCAIADVLDVKLEQLVKSNSTP